MNLNLRPDQIVRVLVTEVFQWRRPVVGLFALISLATLVIGLVWPKGYVASTTILVDQKNIIEPLMQGAAVTTGAADRAKLAREVIFGRKTMTQILADAGWLERDLSPSDQEDLMKQLIARTSVSNAGPNLIKIAYRDDDAERAFVTTKRYAEIFISESLSSKAAESQAAFEFIDRQVQEYHEKLQKSERDLTEFRSANLDARPGSDSDIATRLSGLQTRIEQAMQDLKEAEVKKSSLEKQLSGEAEVASVVSREAQYRARIAELNAQIETLRLSYHDAYPDIVRMRHQIQDLNEAIASEKQRHEAARAAGRVTLDDSVVNNPMYQQLKRELSQTQIQIDTLNARISEARRQLALELDRGKRVHGGEATLAELSRDYQVNRDIYQDLLKRRENARVSMNIDKENQGLSFKVQEPATLPLQPSGLRFWHFIAIGVLAGVVVPIGVLYAFVTLDPRVRVASLIGERENVALLGTIPHRWSMAESERLRQDIGQLGLVVFATFGIMFIFTVLRLAKVI